MKKIKFLLFISIIMLMSSITVYADNEGNIEVVVDVDDELKGTVEFTLKNMQTGTQYSFSLSHVNGYKGRCSVKFGKYELVDYRILDEKRKIVDGTVYLENFEVGLENPNGNWTWYLYPIVTYVADEEVTTTKRVTEKETETTTNIYDILNNLGKDNNEEETTETLIIPADNPYFPNMTLDEIKIWYTKEVNTFISSGGTTKSGWSYELEDYQKSLKYWADDVFDKDKYGMQIEYRGSVEAYDVDESKHFYEVQKKMYDFIKEYQEQNNVYLNFMNWEVAENETSSTEATTSINSSSSTEIDTETTTADETTTIFTEETTSIADTDNANEEDTSFWGKIKDMWLTILILVVAVVAGVIMKIKYSKSNE